jgi:hypothetical protein
MSSKVSAHACAAIVRQTVSVWCYGRQTAATDASKRAATDELMKRDYSLLAEARHPRVLAVLHQFMENK